jgi:membrane peptidoglycan carboxypeptidase
MEVPKSDCTQAIPAEVAHAAAFAMESVFTSGTGSPARVPGAPIFGKTGTADGGLETGATSSWIVGGTTEAVTALWVGNVSGHVNIYNVRANNGYTAYSAKFPTWAGITAAAIAKYGGNAFPSPSQDLITVRQVAIPNVVGQSVEAATSTLEEAGFVVAVSDPVDSDVAAGLVAAQEPGGATASAGTTITLRPSTGTPAASVPDVVGEGQNAAVKAVQDAGYNVKLQCSENDDAPGSGRVTEQSPAAGEAAPRGSDVTLNVQKKNCD